MVAQPAASSGDFARIYAWRRVRPALVAAGLMSLLMSLTWEASYAVLILRLVLLALVAVSVFGLLERWPRRLPRWLARWALQVVGVALVIPFANALIYTLTTFGDPGPWFHDKQRMQGYSGITMFALLVAPWMAMSALYRQISGEAQRQALAFELERSELERQALDARLRVLVAQVEPHFLFNTLANVRELVESGSPNASAVLGSLIAYLRAAVPRLNERTTTIRHELELVRAYLEVMQMRMPDRLKFSVEADAAVFDASCPPTTLLTLVENAVRHGIDPSEVGGRIDVHVRAVGETCRCEVLDTGVGLGGSRRGLGTGLDNLRERLALAFGESARLEVASRAPTGVAATVEFPLRTTPA